jgi:hypothetical protein
MARRRSVRRRAGVIPDMNVEGDEMPMANYCLGGDVKS